MPRTASSHPVDTARVHLVVAAAAMEFGVPELAGAGATLRGPRIDFARQVAMYLSSCQYGMNFSRVGRLFGRDRSTVSHAVRVVEESRTDPVFDAKIERLERFIMAAPA